MTGLGQEDHHGESTVPVRKVYHLVSVILGILVILGLLHHVHVKYLSVSADKGLCRCGRLVELKFPLALEIQGVEQIAEHIDTDFIQNFRHHSVRMVRAPLVDFLHGSIAVGEVHTGNECFIVLANRFLITVQQRILMVDHDGIGDAQGSLFVQFRELLQHRQAILVYGIDLTFPISEHCAYFIGGFPAGAVQNHPQQELHAQRGNDIVLFCAVIDSADVVEGERKALLDEISRFRRNLYFLVGVVRFIIFIFYLLTGDSNHKQAGRYSQSAHPFH